MKFIICSLALAFLCICAWADEHSEQSDKSERPKVHKDELSDKEHFPEGEHSSEYDHGAFLGDQKQEFDELAPEEAKKRLKKLVTKVDKNLDGFITVEELQEWVKSVFDKKVFEGVDTDVNEKDLDKDSMVSWNEYTKATFGNVEDKEKEQDNEVNDYLKRDKRRFESADKDKNGKLNQKEYGHFLHPESSSEMSDLHVLETMEDIDRDKDGFVNLQEFLGDYKDPEAQDQEDPEWVMEETKRFNEEYDKNKDGRLDTQELKAWILPETDHAMAEEEAKHLITSADDDSDGKLSAEEVERNYAVFVGSEATDYGRALPTHEELWLMQ